MPKLILTEKSMREPAKTMCAECPLSRQSTPGFIGGYTVAQYIEILHGPASIACHMSRGFKDGLEGIEDQRHCTGVAAYRANVAARGGLMEPVGTAMAAMLIIGPRADAFAGSWEFAERHEPPKKED